MLTTTEPVRVELVDSYPWIAILALCASVASVILTFAFRYRDSGRIRVELTEPHGSVLVRNVGRLQPVRVHGLSVEGRSTRRGGIHRIRWMLTDGGTLSKPELPRVVEAGDEYKWTAFPLLRQFEVEDWESEHGDLRQVRAVVRHGYGYSRSRWVSVANSSG